MARNKGVFDPTDHVLFDEQRQRFDWYMLQNGCVYRYDTAFGLDSACDRLRELGYLVHRLDAARWTTIADMHAAMAAAMSFPDYYGGNLDALGDVLSDVARFAYGSDPTRTGTVLAFVGYDTVEGLDRRTAERTLHIFAQQARLAALYAHPMLCLVESTVTDYPPVGGHSIHLGPVWDAEPDPPWPIYEGDLFELTFQAYAFDAAAADALAATLREVLADTLTSFGRWQIRDPALASARAARMNAEHRPEPPPEGTRLWVFGIGIRGDGDIGDFDARLVPLLSRAGVHFEQLGMMVHTAGTDNLDDALTRYPELDQRASADGGPEL